LDEFSATWPRSGLMRSGIAYRLPPLVRRICDLGSSFLPTPRAHEHGQYQRDGGQKGKERPTLTGVVMGWLPTPCSTDGSHGGRITPQKGRNGGSLIEALSARMFPTPCATHTKTVQMRTGRKPLVYFPTPRAGGQDNAGGSSSRRIAKERGTYIGRTLSPLFVEWLMGFPLGWTDLEDSAMP
jgi:hypothetical protein